MFLAFVRHQRSYETPSFCWHGSFLSPRWSFRAANKPTQVKRIVFTNRYTSYPLRCHGHGCSDLCSRLIAECVN